MQLLGRSRAVVQLREEAGGFEAERCQRRLLALDACGKGQWPLPVFALHAKPFEARTETLPGALRRCCTRALAQRGDRDDGERDRTQLKFLMGWLNRTLNGLRA